MRLLLHHLRRLAGAAAACSVHRPACCFALAPCVFGRLHALLPSNTTALPDPARAAQPVKQFHPPTGVTHCVDAYLTRAAPAGASSTQSTALDRTCAQSHATPAHASPQGSVALDHDDSAGAGGPASDCLNESSAALSPGSVVTASCAEAGGAHNVAAARTSRAVDSRGRRCLCRCRRVRGAAAIWWAVALAAAAPPRAAAMTMSNCMQSQAAEPTAAPPVLPHRSRDAGSMCVWLCERRRGCAVACRRCAARQRSMQRCSAHARERRRARCCVVLLRQADAYLLCRELYDLSMSCGPFLLSLHA